MDHDREYPYLRKVFFRILLFRLFIPLMIIVLIVTLIIGVYGKQYLERNQKQIVKAISHIVDNHIDNGERILNAVALVAEKSQDQDVSNFMNSAWESYKYFETIYCIDKNYKIKFMEPYDSMYIGLDMSNMPNMPKDLGNLNTGDIIISRPFISLRTGEPIVNLVRPLSNGGYIIGELNLGSFQNEIKSINNVEKSQTAFIMDETGNLISHPSANLVKEQTNMSNLDIFHNLIDGKSSGIYLYNGKLVIGNAAKIEKTGWIVVDQKPLSYFASSYVIGFIIIMLLLILLGGTSILWFGKQIDRYIISPLEQLTKCTNSLAIGEYFEDNLLFVNSTKFYEIHNLIVDFQIMGTNLKQRENALVLSENRNRGLVERLSIGIFRASLTGKILNLNPIGLLMLGYNNIDELSGLNIITFFYQAVIDDKQREFLMENIHNLNNFEIQIKNKNNKHVWVQINSFIVYDSKEKREFFEGSIQDITERKQTEFKIKEQQILLLESEKEKREALEKTLDMKDEFISLISHEFKTPLNVIYSAIQLIEYVYWDKVPIKVQNLMENIKQNTFRQIRLTNNLLDIIKMNSGQIKLNIKKIDVVFLTKVIAKSIEPYANKKNINIFFTSTIQSKIICIDEEKYERIILNILSNAIKFTESKGNITIVVSEKKELDLIQIGISDTGIGIPDDKKDVIFERFGQVDSNLSRRAEGTGIGLSLVKLLIDALEGSIEVESELGEGSTFTITLPINKEASNNELDNDIDDKLVSEIKVQFSDIYL